jgi:histidine ammonia-lyase
MPAVGNLTAASVTLDGGAPALADVVAVARAGATVQLGRPARERMAHSAGLIDGFVESGQPVYGVTTGFGSLARGSSRQHGRAAGNARALARSGMGDPVERRS